MEPYKSLVHREVKSWHIYSFLNNIIYIDLIATTTISMDYMCFCFICSDHIINIYQYFLNKYILTLSKFTVLNRLLFKCSECDDSTYCNPLSIAEKLFCVLNCYCITLQLMSYFTEEGPFLGTNKSHLKILSNSHIENAFYSKGRKLLWITFELLFPYNECGFMDECIMLISIEILFVLDDFCFIYIKVVWISVVKTFLYTGYCCKWNVQICRVQTIDNYICNECDYKYPHQYMQNAMFLCKCNFMFIWIYTREKPFLLSECGYRCPYLAKYGTAILCKIHCMYLCLHTVEKPSICYFRDLSPNVLLILISIIIHKIKQLCYVCESITTNGQYYCLCKCLLIIENTYWHYSNDYDEHLIHVSLPGSYLYFLSNYLFECMLYFIHKLACIVCDFSLSLSSQCYIQHDTFPSLILSDIFSYYLYIFPCGLEKAELLSNSPNKSLNAICNIFYSGTPIK